METKWLEDLFVLAQTRNFSQAAQLRHITQSAFSRRIQSLEAWAGVELVDRTAQPPTLTSAGLHLQEQAKRALGTLHDARTALRNYAADQQQTIDFAATPVLGFSFYPAWSSQIANHVGFARTRLVAQNSVDSALYQGLGGRFDFMLAYHHPSLVRRFDPQQYDMLVLARDMLAPYSKLGADGKPLFELTHLPFAPTPYLAYTPGTCLGPLVDSMLGVAGTERLALRQVYEADMVGSLKGMVLHGHGVAFLPESVVRRELDEGKVGPAHGPVGTLRLEVDICMFRKKPTSESVAKPAAMALWAHLENRSASLPRADRDPARQPVPDRVGHDGPATLGWRPLAVGAY